MSILDLSKQVKGPLLREGEPMFRLEVVKGDLYEVQGGESKAETDFIYEIHIVDNISGNHIWALNHQFRGLYGVNKVSEEGVYISSRALAERMKAVILERGSVNLVHWVRIAEYDDTEARSEYFDEDEQRHLGV